MSAYVPPKRKQRDERHYRVTTLCKSRGFPSKNSFSSKWMSNDHSQPNSFLDSGPPVMDKQTIIFREYGMKCDNRTARDRKKQPVERQGSFRFPPIYSQLCFNPQALLFGKLPSGEGLIPPKYLGSPSWPSGGTQVFRFTGGFGEGKT